MTRRRWAIPYLLLAPGILWLVLFFVLPSVQMFVMSLSTQAGGSGLTRHYEFSWAWQNYVNAITDFPEQFVNSLVYGAMATLLCLLIGYPLAYGIAFRGGRYKTFLLFLVIAPFFTSFLIRTISWKIILGNDGAFLSIIRDVLGIVPPNFSILGTPLAVIAGLTYEFLPFMVLPLYVSLEKIDRRLIEAAQDLYAGPWRRGGALTGGLFGGVLAVGSMAAFGYLPLGVVHLPGILLVFAIGAGIGAAIATLLVSESFTRVIFPLSLSGLFAGSILTFIPAIGDYVNAELLGNPKTQMIGNVIQNQYLQQNNYPTASALSFLLMAGILIAIFLYARALGTDELTGGARMTAIATQTKAQARGATPARSVRRSVDRWLIPVYTAVALFYLALPILVMIAFSFNDPPGRFNFVWGEFSLAAWQNPFGRPGLQTAIVTSLGIAFVSTIFATALGTLIALALSRYNFRGRTGTSLFIFIPMATPEIVLGASLLTLFVGTSQDPIRSLTGGFFFPLGIQTILIAHIMFNISFVVVTVRARMQGFPRHLEEAAMDLGATPWATFWKVTFPLILPGILAGALLAFSLSIDDFIITNFTAGTATTFPLWVWASIRNNLPPQVQVIGTMVFVGAVLLVALNTLWERRGERRDRRIAAEEAAREVRLAVATE